MPMNTAWTTADAMSVWNFWGCCPGNRDQRLLYRKYEDLPEGDLTKIRASIVCEPTLAYCAGDISLGEYLLLGKGEDATGGRNRNSVVSATPWRP